MDDHKKIFLLNMKRRSLVLLCALGASSQAFAAVMYLGDNRRVESDGDDGSGYYGSVATPDAAFADFSTYGQTSSLGMTSFTASGSGSAYSDFGWSSTWSYFDVSFNLSTASQFTLTGNLYGEDILYGSGDASISLYSGTSAVAANLIYSDSVAASYGIEEKILSFNSLLTAGDYRIVVAAEPYFQEAYSSYGVQVDISAVPVPAAVWLFGSGLIGLIGVAKARKTAVT
ncbi:hypothetical protein MNBD_GAMMA25-956 [hydrothermal vent metagenome]|uniref:PEP-CTERM protein-sorting domain-containing protein n=1 Tax=hydrothermal vent metagenome TaxID=652676 RepID=A0A3B1BDA8_9ZZZZ